MELADCSSSSRKRKSSSLSFSMEELNQDLLERVLSWLPTSTFFRLSSVCKRWKSVADSPSFKLACSQIPSRDPWFLMVDHQLNHSIVFDSAEKTWKELNFPNSSPDSIPVAASGGLVCFRTASGKFIVSNPVTGSSRELPPLDADTENQSLHAIVMTTSSKHPCNYKLVLVYGELPKLSFKVYNSCLNCWEEETLLLGRKNEQALEVDSIDHHDDEDAVYFLSKAGNVVATNMQRSPSKQYSSVITSKEGEEIVYFLNSCGTIVACNLTQKSFTEYPRLLPVFSEYSIDVVECRGELLVVVLSEFLESASLRVWRFDQDNGFWHQVAAMPPAMSHEFYGKKVDINCVAAGHQIFICFNSAELFSYVLCDLVTKEWVELPKCSMNGEAVDFMSAFSFEPRIEVAV
ncbi:hypothetical protein AB3S75_020547 [Citrus x aurantiifolia]